MHPITRFLIVSFTASLLLFSACSKKVEIDTPPNIVVILCDDLGYGDLECYGHPHIKTPNLNQMAAEGIRFTDFYSAAPVCSPSRVGLLTGRSPNRAGVYDWIPPSQDVHMQASETTIPQLLKAAGYATCMSGKWHCNAKFNSPEQPQPGDAGFDHWFGTQNNAKPSHENPVNFVRNGEEVGPLEGYSCQLVVDEALTWLEGKQQETPDQPFFMYVAFHEPHEPVASPENLVGQYRDVASTEDEAQYFANVANIDAAVGKLMNGLKEMELDENTLVIFTSDNGPETLNRYRTANRSYGTPAPLRGMKLWTTDAGFRVAGIMRWPLKIKGGDVVDQAVSSLDFLPTFCELAETQPPAELSLDGTSFLPALTGKPIVRDKPLFWVYYHAINERRVAMRDGDWKVLARLDLPKYKMVNSNNVNKARAAKLSDIHIFNIRNDIAESQDLSSDNPEKFNELKLRLEEHYKELVEDSHVWPAPTLSEVVPAALEGNQQLVRQALNQYFDPNELDPEGRTAIMYAAFNGHTDVVANLIASGADVNVQDTSGSTALMFASSGPSTETVALLLEKGAKINTVDNIEHFSALMWAAAEGQMDNVKLLLKHNADTTLQDIDGDTAETFAAKAGHAAVAEVLKAAANKVAE